MFDYATQPLLRDDHMATHASIQDAGIFANQIDANSHRFSLENHVWYRAPHGSGWMRFFIKKFSAKHAALYHVLCRRIFGEYLDDINTTYQKLSEWTGFSVRTVGRMLKDLREHRILEVTRAPHHLNIIPRGQDVPFDKCIPQITDCIPHIGPYAAVVLHALVAKIKCQLSKPSAQSIHCDPYQCAIPDTWLKTVGVPEKQIKNILTQLTDNGWVEIEYKNGIRHLTLMSLPMSKTQNAPVRLHPEFDRARSVETEAYHRQQRQQKCKGKVVNNPTQTDDHPTQKGGPIGGVNGHLGENPQDAGNSTTYGKIGEERTVNLRPITKDRVRTKEEEEAPAAEPRGPFVGLSKKKGMQNQDLSVNPACGKHDPQKPKSGPHLARQEATMGYKYQPKQKSDSDGKWWDDPINPFDLPIFRRGVHPDQRKEWKHRYPLNPIVLTALYSCIEFVGKEPNWNTFEGLLINAINKKMIPRDGLPLSDMEKLSWCRYIAKRYYPQLKFLESNGCSIECSMTQISITHTSMMYCAKWDGRDFFYQLLKIEKKLNAMECPDGFRDPFPIFICQLRPEAIPPKLDKYCPPKKEQSRRERAMEARDDEHERIKNEPIFTGKMASEIKEAARQFDVTPHEQQQNQYDQINSMRYSSSKAYKQNKTHVMGSQLKKDLTRARARAAKLDPERVADAQRHAQMMGEKMRAAGVYNASDISVPLSPDG